MGNLHLLFTIQLFGIEKEKTAMFFSGIYQGGTDKQSARQHFLFAYAYKDETFSTIPRILSLRLRY